MEREERERKAGTWWLGVDQAPVWATGAKDDWNAHIGSGWWTSRAGGLEIGIYMHVSADFADFVRSFVLNCHQTVTNRTQR